MTSASGTVFVGMDYSLATKEASWFLESYQKVRLSMCSNHKLKVVALAAIGTGMAALQLVSFACCNITGFFCYYSLFGCSALCLEQSVPQHTACILNIQLSIQMDMHIPRTSCCCNHADVICRCQARPSPSSTTSAFALGC